MASRFSRRTPCRSREFLGPPAASTPFQQAAKAVGRLLQTGRVRVGQGKQGLGAIHPIGCIVALIGQGNPPNYALQGHSARLTEATGRMARERSTARQRKRRI